MNSVFKFFQVLFYIFMALFLIGGVGIVAIQTFGILSASGETVTGVNDWLSPWVLVALLPVRFVPLSLTIRKTR